MAVLAVGSVFGGLLNLTAAGGRMTEWLGSYDVTGVSGVSDAAFEAMAVIVTLLMLGVGWYVWGSGRFDWAALRVRMAGGRRMLQRGFYVDDVYAAVFGQLGKLGAAFVSYFIERRLFDGLWREVAHGVGVSAAAGRRLQDGLVRRYALALLVGVVGILAFVAVRVR